MISARIVASFRATCSGSALPPLPPLPLRPLPAGPAFRPLRAGSASADCPPVRFALGFFFAAPAFAATRHLLRFGCRCSGRLRNCSSCSAAASAPGSGLRFSGASQFRLRPSRLRRLRRNDLRLKFDPAHPTGLPLCSASSSQAPHPFASLSGSESSVAPLLVLLPAKLALPGSLLLRRPAPWRSNVPFPRGAQMRLRFVLAGSISIASLAGSESSSIPPLVLGPVKPASLGFAGSPLAAPLRESPVLPVARPAQPAPAFRVLPPSLRPPRMTFVPRPCARASVPPVACFSSGQKASVANTLLCRALYCLWLHGMAAILFTAFTTPSG